MPCMHLAIMHPLADSSSVYLQNSNSFIFISFKLNVAKDQEKNKQTKNKKEQPNLSRHLMRTLEGWRWRGKGTEERKGTYRN